ncbi:MAG: DNA repair protein RadC [Lachnospiraceae bacterium]|jgi:DNA repair protein RadC|nr:DNA repair protein RadC [Lachnospiraceae bacterium]
MNSRNSAAEKPYERFVCFGAQSLTDAELIAIMLRTGTKDSDAVDIGRKILTGNRSGKEPSLSVLYDLTLKDLLAIRGIGEVKAIRILSIAELSRRLSQCRESGTLSFSSPDSVYRCYGEKLRHKDREELLLLMLDNRLSLIAEEVVTVGTVNSTLISVREIFSLALREKAVNIMLLHNHPSGDPTPSEQDISVTGRIREAGELLEIRLVDHIIVGDDFYSMKQMGLLS